MKFLALVCAAIALGHAAPVSNDELASNKAEGLRLISLAENEEPVWKTEDEKLDLMRNKVQFVRGPIQLAIGFFDINC